MIAYLDASVILRVVLAQPKRLASWGKWERAYSSELLQVEAMRTIDRLRLLGTFTDRDVAASVEDLGKVGRALGRIPLTRAVLEFSARPMATVVRTLDMIHLASAALLKERRGIPIVFCTHDEQQATAAKAMGLACMTK